VFTALGFASVLVVYFAPTIVALLRAHNPGGVSIVNLVLGWTLIGWCVALVMACGANGRARVG
jgi:T4 superinfection immunity protein